MKTTDVTVKTTPIKKLPKYLKEAFVNVSKEDVKLAVKEYYQYQEHRIALAAQIRELDKAAAAQGTVAHHEFLDYSYSNMMQQEEEHKKAIDAFVSAHPVGAWLKQINGIGPIIAGTLLCNLDVTKAPSVSHFYSYVGLNDNNIPWLGKEGATEVVNSCIEETEEKIYDPTYEMVKKEVTEEVTAKSERKAAKWLKNKDGKYTNELEKVAEYTGYSIDDLNIKNIVLDYILNEEYPHEKIEKLIKKKLSGGETKKSKKDKSEITDEVLQKIAEKTNRKYAQLVRYATNEKGEYDKTKLIKELSKPPYNIELKKLCWKIGESFVKVSNKPESLYGRIYKERKAYESAKNEALEYKDQAEYKLAHFNIGKTTDAYKAYSQGKLPDDHIHSRSKRYTVKIFISHLYDEMYKYEFGKNPPRAYVFEHLNHVDVIPPEVPGIVIED